MNYIYKCGISHLDDLEVCEFNVPTHKYNLILYNPTSNTTNEFQQVRNWIDGNSVIIGGNPDPYKNPIHALLIKKKIKVPYYDNLPRPQFLGLLKNCERFITNSSAAYYEAPAFLALEQIIIVGERNKNRSTPAKLETGASDKIVKILEDYFNINEEVQARFEPESKEYKDFRGIF